MYKTDLEEYSGPEWKISFREGGGRNDQALLHRSWCSKLIAQAARGARMEGRIVRDSLVEYTYETWLAILERVAYIAKGSQNQPSQLHWYSLIPKRKERLTASIGNLNDALSWLVDWLIGGRVVEVGTHRFRSQHWVFDPRVLFNWGFHPLLNGEDDEKDYKL